MKKIMLSWIAFHGITDIFCDNFIIFYILVPLSIKIPMDILNTMTLILSVLHFSNDNIIPLEAILYMLPILLYFGEYRISQYTMLGYLSFIHVPIHFSYTLLNYRNIIILMLFYMCIYNFKPLLNLLDEIITSGGRLPNNDRHKLLLGILNAHILTNSRSFIW